MRERRDDAFAGGVAIKQSWGSRVTSVFPRQGHYAQYPEVLANCPPVDAAYESKAKSTFTAPCSPW
jgi:hypothetical protein